MCVCVYGEGGLSRSGAYAVYHVMSVDVFFVNLKFSNKYYK